MNGAKVKQRVGENEINNVCVCECVVRRSV